MRTMNAVAVAVVFAVSGQAMAQHRLADRMQALAQKLASVENKLKNEDYESVEHQLDRIDSVLRDVPAPAATASLTCLFNGEQGSYERFKLSDLSTGARGAVVCASNGEQGRYERFHLYSRALDKPLGGNTSLQQCLGSIPTP